jgi:glycosyltransferase involved in cell wall biosynthesis
VLPEYTLPGIEFRQVVRRPLWSETRTAWSAITNGIKHFPDLPVVRSAADAKAALVLCQWTTLIQQEIRRFKPDVLHSHWAMPAGSGGYLAAQSERVPLVMTLRGCDHLKSTELAYGDCLDPFYERTLERAVVAADALTICCETSRRRIEELGVKPSSPKVTKLFHAVDADRFRGTVGEAEEWKRRFRLEGRRVTTCVALMDGARKGHSTLLRALRIVRRAHPDAALLLVGEGSHQNVLKQECRELELDDHVVFAGRVHPQDVQHVMRLAELTVLPTHIEVFGNAVFESLIMGIPVISGNVGAAADVFAERGFGLLFEPGDVDQLAAAMLSVMASPEEFRDRARSGKQFVIDHMNVNARIEGFLEVYRRVIEARSSG